MGSDEKAAEILVAIEKLGDKIAAMDVRLTSMERKLDAIAVNTLGPSQARALGIHADPVPPPLALVK